jgi:hypothetical protein
MTGYVDLGPVLPDSPRLLASKYDGLFKQIITAGWAVKSDGNVESPLGYFALVEIPSSSGERDEMSGALELNEHDQQLFEELTSAWFITREMNTGIIYVYQCGELFAKTWYDRLEKIFLMWEAESDE